MTPDSSLRLLRFFRNVAIAEGWSFLVLLLIAMPLKYLAKWPHGVTVVGWAHGVLFVAFLALALRVYLRFNKPFLFLIRAFFASILPLGTFIFERQLRKNGELPEPLR